jgi:nucleotide-binding universal stress UspA family protein
MPNEGIDVDAMDATDYLTAVAHTYDLDGEGMKVVIVKGLHALTILDTAKEQQADLIVLVGCRDPKLLRSTPVPVLILPYEGKIPCTSYPDRMRPLHSITGVVALDGSLLAEASLEPAAQLVAALASPAQGSLHLVRVVQPAQGKGGRHVEEWVDPRIQEQAIDEASNYLKQKAEGIHERLETEFNLAVTWSVVVESGVADALIRAAEDGTVTRGSSIFGGSDLLVLSTHGRSGLQRLVSGSVMERIAGHTKLPLLVVRPAHSN